MDLRESVELILRSYTFRLNAQMLPYDWRCPLSERLLHYPQFTDFDRSIFYMYQDRSNCSTAKISLRSCDDVSVNKSSDKELILRTLMQDGFKNYEHPISTLEKMTNLRISVRLKIDNGQSV